MLSFHGELENAFKAVYAVDYDRIFPITGLAIFRRFWSDLKIAAR